ncbi:MAG TPA: competence/damage-inducible protein A [bacterium]
MNSSTLAFVTVGNEILSGSVQDANMRYFALNGKAHGIRILSYEVVPDDLDRISSTLKKLIGNVDIVIVSGGLGPTSDDLTREAAGKTFGKKMILNRKELARLKEFFEKRGFGFPESNTKQVTFPDGAKILINSAGTAPGFAIKKGKTQFCFLPGVPGEFRAMVDAAVLPLITRRAKYKVAEKTYKIFGLPESRIGEMLEDFPISGFEIAFLPDFPEVHVKFSRIIKKDAVETVLFTDIDKKLNRILGDLIFGVNGDTLESVAGRLLIRQNKTLSVAESITGGLIGEKITRVAGSSRYFIQSLVCYSNDSKIRLLGVKEDTLRKSGAVSRQAAIEMANGVRQHSGADVGISVTGIAGPSGGSAEKPAGTVFIGISGGNIESAQHYVFAGMPRDKVRALTATTALDLLRRFLIMAAPFNG